MYFLYIVTAAAFLFSLIKNREKTYKAVRIAAGKFASIFPAFLAMLILISIVLFLVPEKVISDHMGNSDKFIGLMIASFFGSITLMPGFVSFPLAGILLGKGVSYMVLSAFTTTLMMVGVLTFPIEKAYFGTKVTIIRNLIGLLIALATALMTGIFFGEVF